MGDKTKDCTTCTHYEDSGLTEWFECTREPEKYRCIRKYDTEPCEKYEVKE